MSASQLRILHCLRAPVGGAFRHVLDLASEQARMGHAVGLICDSETGGESAKQALAQHAYQFQLGVYRFPMPRSVSPNDAVTLLKTMRTLSLIKADVVHGHGAKGGVYARLAGTLSAGRKGKLKRIYSPHGGSLHFDSTALKGRIYLGLEKALRAFTDAICFVSRSEENTYRSKVGDPSSFFKIVHNGLHEREFEPTLCLSEAEDFLYFGELRDLKGTDVLISALKLLNHRTGKNHTLAIVGDGPDMDAYKAQVADLELDEHVHFHGRLPAAQAFRLGKTGVMPSRAEAFPYAVLEMIAAGKPLIATNVGGIPEVYAGHEHLLVPPGSVEQLATAMEHAARRDPAYLKELNDLKHSVHTRFNASRMAEEITTLYHPPLHSQEAHTQARRSRAASGRHA
ncbi:glycosyltransferase family 4 protein [Pseudovibrio sp. SPO723]|uniref:glycosyltransferase family 4 protein n=1 Tax=Nesiotobacter zosterae TaxID=392721 RepID=UPI0029C3AD33|nr:glycosyltransferase family 4 protein [Pseudovibrio sp. SPO723]MDX5592607.1 glycosyltransferase family 4 protein [Pseudovibrio sp. SPO723]